MAGRGEDLGVAYGGHPAPFAFQRPSHDSCATDFPPATNDLVDEANEIVGKANGDLFAHTKMVPPRDAPSRGGYLSSLIAFGLTTSPDTVVPWCSALILTAAGIRVALMRQKRLT